MGLGDIVNKLHNEDGLTDTGTTEESNLTSSGVGGRVSVDGSVLVSEDGTTLINGLTDNVDDSSEGLGTDGHQNGGSNIADTLSSNETLGGVKGNSAHVVTTQMLGDFEDESVGAVLNLKGVQNRGELALELDIDDGTNDLGNFAHTLGVLGSGSESAFGEIFAKHDTLMKIIPM